MAALMSIKLKSKILHKSLDHNNIIRYLNIRYKQSDGYMRNGITRIINTEKQKLFLFCNICYVLLKQSDN